MLSLITIYKKYVANYLVLAGLATVDFTCYAEPC